MADNDTLDQLAQITPDGHVRTDLDLAAVYAAEDQLAHQAAAVLGPNTAACVLCGARPGEVCGMDCPVALIDPAASAAAEDDDRIACDDCGAHVGQRCSRTCPRYTDL